MTSLAIIAILAGITLLVLKKVHQTAKDKQCWAAVAAMGKSLEFYAAKYGGAYPDSLSQLVNAGYLPSLPVCPYESSGTSNYTYETATNAAGYTTYYTITCGTAHASGETPQVTGKGTY